MIGTTITLILLALIVAPFIYLRRTRYFVRVKSSVTTGKIVVSIRRRFFMSWPAEAYTVASANRRDSLLYYGSGSNLNYTNEITYATVSADSVDAEQVLKEKTAEAKAVVKDWKNRKRERQLVRAAMMVKLLFFTILMFLLIVSVVGGTVFQIHRHRTPFYVNVLRDESMGTLNVYVFRRAFRAWPPEAQEVHGRQFPNYDPRYVSHHERLGSTTMRVLVNKINVHEPDADEKVLESVVEAKTLVKRWGQAEDMDALYKYAKKSLKR